MQLVKAINETSVAAFRSAVAEYLDLQKFLRHVAVEVFLADNDGFLGDYGINNFYFYRFTDKKLFTFIAVGQEPGVQQPDLLDLAQHQRRPRRRG